MRPRISRGFGILIEDNQQPSVPKSLLPFVQALHRRVGAEPMRGRFFSQVFLGEPWFCELYDGNNVAPAWVGIELPDSWGPDELRDEVVEGVMRHGLATAMSTLPSEAELAAWRTEFDEVTASIRDLIDEHGVQPVLFWTSSNT